MGIIHSSAEYKSILKSYVAGKNIKLLEELGEKAGTCYEEYNLHDAVDAVMNMLRMANQLFDHHQLWRLIKLQRVDSSKEVEAVISLVLENVRVAALVLHPIIPRLTSNLLDHLQIPMENRTWRDTRPLHLTNLSNKTRNISSQNLMFFQKIKY